MTLPDTRLAGSGSFGRLGSPPEVGTAGNVCGMPGRAPPKLGRLPRLGRWPTFGRPGRPPTAGRPGRPEGPGRLPVGRPMFVGPATFGRGAAGGSFADGPTLPAALDSCVAVLRLAAAAARAAARRAWRFTPGMAVGDFVVAGR